MNDSTMMKMQALSDLETNMDQLQRIIEQKDEVIDGLKRSLDKALTRLENGEGSSPSKVRQMPKVINKYELEIRCAALEKTIQSYDQAVKILTQKHNQERRDQKAKEKIVE